MKARLKSMADEIIELSHNQFESYGDTSIGANKIFLFALDKQSEKNTNILTQKAVDLSNFCGAELLLISSAICYVDKMTYFKSYSRLKHVQERIVSKGCMKYKIFRLGYFTNGCELPYIREIGKSIFVLGSKNSVLPAFDEKLFLDSIYSSDSNRIFRVFSICTKYVEAEKCFPNLKIFYTPVLIAYMFLFLSILFRLIGLINLSNKLARPFYGEISFT